MRYALLVHYQEMTVAELGKEALAEGMAALAWAEKCPAAQYGVVEIRPSAMLFRDGQWQGEFDR